MPCSDPYVKVTFAPASGVESLKGEKTTTIKKVCYAAEQDVQLDTIWIMFGCRRFSCAAEVFPRALPNFPSLAVLFCMQMTECWV